MKIDASDIADLQPIIAAAVQSTLDAIHADAEKLDGKRLGYPEAEAAALLGLARHCLRDARLRGEIHARMVGNKYIYSRDTLLKFLADTK